MPLGLSHAFAMADVRQRLKVSLRDAIKARDPVAIAALRSAISALDNAEAVEGPARVRPHLGLGAADVARRELSQQDVVQIVRAEIDERLAAAAEYHRLGRMDDARRLGAEAGVLESHLRGA